MHALLIFHDAENSERSGFTEHFDIDQSSLCDFQIAPSDPIYH